MQQGKTTETPGERLLRALGMRKAEPVKVAPHDLVELRCRKCGKTVHQVVTQGIAHVVDREEFKGMVLLSLHPCFHEWTEEDFIDPDWGWVEC